MWCWCLDALALINWIEPYIYRLCVLSQGSRTVTADCLHFSRDSTCKNVHKLHSEVLSTLGQQTLLTCLRPYVDWFSLTVTTAESAEVFVTDLWTVCSNVSISRLKGHVWSLGVWGQLCVLEKVQADVCGLKTLWVFMGVSQGSRADQRMSCLSVHHPLAITTLPSSYASSLWMQMSKGRSITILSETMLTPTFHCEITG